MLQYRYGVVMELTFYKLVKVIDDPLTYLMEAGISVSLPAAVLSDSENLYFCQT